VHSSARALLYLALVFFVGGPPLQNRRAHAVDGVVGDIMVMRLPAIM
jgi:hypothetical protein